MESNMVDTRLTGRLSEVYSNNEKIVTPSNILLLRWSDYLQLILMQALLAVAVTTKHYRHLHI